MENLLCRTVPDIFRQPVVCSCRQQTVIARAQAQDVIRCQYCEDEAAVFQCVPCGDELCPRCKELHLKSKVPSGHNVIRLSERLHPSNLVKMCEIHSSKVYEACCEDCQVPVCILCIQKMHGKHSIGRIQDIFEKQKAETKDEMSKINAQWKPEITQRIEDFKKWEQEIKTSHKNIRHKMRKQSKDFIDNIKTILKEAIRGSDKDERKKLKEIYRKRAETEKFKQDLEKLNEKLNKLTESSHPADLLLYRKQTPDVFKELMVPDKLNIVMPTFTAGQLNTSQNEHQFGTFTTGCVNNIKSHVDSLQPKKLPRTAQRKASAKKVLERPVKISERKIKDRLIHIYCVGDETSYIIGFDSGIQLIDKSGTQLDSTSTENQPHSLALMRDGSLIYADCHNNVIYKVSHNKEEELIHTEDRSPEGLCCTRSDDIVVGLSDLISSVVIKYNSKGKKMKRFKPIQNGERIFTRPHFICENVNGDICISNSGYMNNRVVVFNKSGNLRFRYDGNVLAKLFRNDFDPHGVATDSLGHILVADLQNNAIHLISKDGDFLSYILTKGNGISTPYGISVDTSDNLWIIEYKNPCMKVYQFLS